ncbi:hypothetical protein HWC21_gp016 [Vibrio phage VAP7]|uniref:Uncharacterized protein n=2 Tax=Vapseptimavirus VAP7 TaxID=2841303 RepID=A0A4Y5TV50_9CAUD|nr:hypothetical protein HWC21_gp016 [Vibrio phage VAP7]AWY10191.1 hypothetical protein [Vibrio phage VP-1]QDB73198.1 hypothetical protein [Vibrio phage VAP7]UFD98117.1 hypothetical protein [Vibrio phage BX-1]
MFEMDLSDLYELSYAARMRGITLTEFYQMAPWQVLTQIDIHDYLKEQELERRKQQQNG